MKKQKRLKNTELAIIQKNDPARLRIRTVEAEKGSGRKDRPRQNDWNDDRYNKAA